VGRFAVGRLLMQFVRRQLMLPVLVVKVVKIVRFVRIVKIVRRVLGSNSSNCW
jgi:hypothetical protein